MVTSHRYFANLELAVAGAIHAGVNQFLNPYQSALEEPLRNGRVAPEDVDARLSGVFRVMIHLGLLDPPQRNSSAAIGRDGAKAPWDAASSRELVLEATHESIVLLKNAATAGRSPLLPLDASKLDSIAVVGPRTIVVLVSSFPYAIDWIEAHVPAVVHMAHSSEEEGTALAQGLFGDADPGGPSHGHLAAVAHRRARDDGLRYP
jgi:beta-glucosidase